MSDLKTLRDAIAEELAQGYKSYELAEVCSQYGIACNKDLDPSSSKRLYVNSGLIKQNQAQLLCLAKAMISQGCSCSFVRSVEGFFDDDFFDIPMSVRRVFLNWLIDQPDLLGESSIIQLLSPAWNLEVLSVTGWDGGTCNARDYITKHMVQNDDITWSELFENLLDFIYVPDRVVFRFIETIVNPPFREGQAQERYVNEVNSIISACGHALSQYKAIAGLPHYKMGRQAVGIRGQICNIIFAAVGGKPDIIIQDALANKLEIVDDKADCLFYTCPIGQQGLSWHDLVTWWNDGNEEYDIVVERDLVNRLRKSLDSPAEELFLRRYYNYLYRIKDNERPALLPQVYCHYDPKSARMRGGEKYVYHQRMDFLLLFPGNVRVVIEIDGKQHYSEEDTASPKKYAEMVSDDRALKLYGYDVYRFGGYELTEAEKANAMIDTFLAALFEKYPNSN